MGKVELLRVSVKNDAFDAVWVGELRLCVLLNSCYCCICVDYWKYKKYENM